MKLKKTIKIISVIFVFYYFSLLYSNSIARQPFDWDEYNFLKKSYYYDLFVKADFSDVRWYEGEDSAQPKLGPYIYGFALHLAGFDNLDGYLKEIRFNEFLINDDLWYRTYAWKIIVDYPPDFQPIYEILTVGRVVSTIFLLVMLLLVYLVCLKVGGFMHALISVLIIGFSNLFLLMGRMATTDNMLLMFMTLTAYLLVLYAENIKKSGGAKLLLPVLIGAASALCLGVKIVGIISLFLVIAVFMYFDRKIKQKDRSRLAFEFLIVLISFSVTFYILHPFLYKHPVYNFLEMFHGRIEGSYLDRFKFPTSSIYGFFDRIGLILTKTFLPLNGKIVSYPLLVIANLFLTATGVLGLYRNRNKGGEAVILIWFGVILFTLLIYLKNNWLRYYLPLTLIVGIVESYALKNLIPKTFSKIRKYLV